MKRRTFLTTAGAAGLTLAARESAVAAHHEGERQYFELRTYRFEDTDQKRALSEFIATSGIPTLNRLGVGPVGSFDPIESDTELYLLLPHKDLDSVANLTHAFLADNDLQTVGAVALNATLDSPLYTGIDSNLSIAFQGMPRVETPTAAESRVFQLRIYQSPSAKLGQTKIAMFHDGEIDIFRRVGLDPVFFGETLVGQNMPNLTYMVGFENPDAQKAAWQAFSKDPQWQELRAKPEYQDLVSGITNIELRPAPGSQI